MRILFVGHNGYGYPHTRVRCYHFAKILAAYPQIETGVLSFRDTLAPHKTEAEIYTLRDREKLVLTAKALGVLLRERKTILYIQKAHFHAAAPFLLHRLGFCKHYLFDYDDYDIPLSNFFGRGVWNRLFFGSNRWDAMTHRLIRQAKGCVAASHFLLDFLHEHNESVVYVPTGVDTTLFTPPPRRPDSGPVIFLWNGLVWGEPIVRNILLMLRAFRSVHASLPEYRLRLVGGGDQWNALKQIAARDFAMLAIEWQDWVAPEAMPDLLRQADVGLLPADGEDRWLCSKSPTKLFEYMAAGLPVAASQVGEVQFVQEHKETGFLADREADFSQALLALGHDTDLRWRMGRRARQVAETRFSLPVLGEHLYHYILERFSCVSSGGRLETDIERD